MEDKKKVDLISSGYSCYVRPLGILEDLPPNSSDWWDDDKNKMAYIHSRIVTTSKGELTYEEFLKQTGYDDLPVLIAAILGEHPYIIVDRMPIIVFNFAYDIYTPNSDAEPARSVDVINLYGNVNSITGNFTYPAENEVMDVLHTKLVTRHRYKRFIIDDSTFDVLVRANTYEPLKSYASYDFKGLQPLIPEARDLISAIKAYVISEHTGVFPTA